MAATKRSKRAKRPAKPPPPTPPQYEVIGANDLGFGVDDIQDGPAMQYLSGGGNPNYIQAGGQIVPRLEGYRERLHYNIYDAIELLTYQNADRMFGNRNVGDFVRTNLLIGGQFPADSTFVAMRLYARTNAFTSLSPEVLEIIRDAAIEGRDGDVAEIFRMEQSIAGDAFNRAFVQWAHSTVIEFTVGMRPMFVTNAADLLKQRRRVRTSLPTSQDAMAEPVAIKEWVALPGDFERPIVIPVRQNFQVTVTSHTAALNAMRVLMPPDILPSPMFWVHMDGLMTRDIA